MSDSWQVNSLDKCLSKVIDYRGKTPKKLGGDWSKSGYKVISANNVKFNGLNKLDSINYLDEELYRKWMKDEVEKGDLLLTSEAPSGQVMIWDSNEKIVLSQRLFALRTGKNIYNKYLKYYLQSPMGQKEVFRNNSGSTVSGISAKTFSNILVRYPSKDHQVRIGDLLYSLDQKIELNTRINAELEAMAKMLYDYWFVQFDFPDNDNKPYKANADKMMWNDQLKREIPDGWKVHKVGEILDVSLGGTPSTSNPDYWENGTINWLSSGEMNNFPIVKAESKITEEALNNSATKLMPKGTVAISITRYIRPTILAIDSCANQSVVGIHESSIFKSSYLYPLFLNEVARYMVIRTGAMQPHINKETINSTPIIEPSDLVLEKYYKIATPIYQKIINNAKQNQELIELRDFILPLLMNGQVRVN